MSKVNAFELEWQNTLRILSDKNSDFSELDYFLKLADDYSKFHFGNKPKVVLPGLYFPDEIIRAMGIDFCYVCGGSYESTLSDCINLPKDTDDEIRSIVGILKSDSLNLNKDDVILVPLCNDNMKKLKALVDDSVTAICYEVPSCKEDSLQKDRFLNEIDRVTRELEKHFKKKLSSKKLKEQCEISKQSAVTFCKLEKMFKENKSGLSPSVFLFIANTYRMCKNKAEWTSHTECLIHQLSTVNNSDSNSYPPIMLFGSQIFAPDYKTLFAIEEKKLRLFSIIHPDIEHIRSLLNIDIKSVSVKYLASMYLDSDISPVYINNTELNDLVMNEINSNIIKGVIAFIIKGQIEHDFSFKTIEKLTENVKIPLIRIETVYSSYDIEQILLRLEAFAEMLNMSC